jgi:YfiH family protein
VSHGPRSSPQPFLRPQWPAPATVQALVTGRTGGISRPPYDSLNLGDHVGDDPAAVAANRQSLQTRAGLPAVPLWLSQVHGTRCVNAAQAQPGDEADAVMAQAPGLVCAIMTADCLPLLLCDRAGSRVGAAHAGWRGLLDGVIESTLAALDCPPGEVLAWLGPAIGPRAFEVGPEVRAAFITEDPAAATAFTPKNGPTEKWLCDIYALARLRLARAGVTAVYGGEHCTYTEKEDFFSYRRDGTTGRMASLIWLQPR